MKREFSNPLAQTFDRIFFLAQKIARIKMYKNFVV